jgi:hypothetical protein
VIHGEPVLGVFRPAGKAHRLAGFDLAGGHLVLPRSGRELDLLHGQAAGRGMRRGHDGHELEAGEIDRDENDENRGEPEPSRRDIAAGGVVPGPESTTDLRWITYQNIPANGSSMAIVIQNAPQPENKKSSM